MTFVDTTLNKLAALIEQGTFTELETEGLEIKPVPAIGNEWKEVYKSVNAFLNTRGGIVFLGVKEEGQGSSRRYVFTGWKEHAESNLKEIPRLFTDRSGVPQDLSDCFPPMELRDFLDGRIAIIYVDELAADRRYVFHDGTAYKRLLTGDHKLTKAEVDAQEEFKEEAVHARELQPVPGMTVDDLDLDKLNAYISELNKPVRVETIKADIASALPFLERKFFVKDGTVTTLGALVCARHPGERLGFRSHVHGYVDLVGTRGDSDADESLVQDKQDFVDNVLQLMEQSLGYLLRNIRVGISTREGGTAQPQYPPELLRETINNALAHRDYSIDRQVILTIKPGEHISIQNPGGFRKHLLIEHSGDSTPLRRILPEAKPRNPKLADVLRVYRKWEGRGIGMATLVNLALDNKIDLPYYLFFTQEVRLHVPSGRLLDERMERLFQSFDGFLETRLHGSTLNEEQKLVLSYVIKSQWANERLRYTILLTPDNNHFAALQGLEQAGLIEKHSTSTSTYPVYLANPVFMSRGHIDELRALFGTGFDNLGTLLKEVLGVVYRFNHYSKAKTVSPKEVGLTLWHEGRRAPGGVEQFDLFSRKVRHALAKLASGGFIAKRDGTRGYHLREDYQQTHLL